MAQPISGVFNCTETGVGDRVGRLQGSEFRNVLRRLRRGDDDDDEEQDERDRVADELHKRIL